MVLEIPFSNKLVVFKYICKNKLLHYENINHKNTGYG
jgi:hypothetical protein